APPRRRTALTTLTGLTPDRCRVRLCSASSVAARAHNRILTSVFRWHDLTSSLRRAWRRPARPRRSRDRLLSLVPLWRIARRHGSRLPLSRRNARVARAAAAVSGRERLPDDRLR